jgi:AraC-like DNA-binding protein
MREQVRWRLREAARRPRESAQSIAEIARAVGFSAEAPFSRAFKREYGEGPGAWRKRKRGQLLG